MSDNFKAAILDLIGIFGLVIVLTIIWRHTVRLTVDSILEHHNIVCKEE